MNTPHLFSTSRSGSRDFGLRNMTPAIFQRPDIDIHLDDGPEQTHPYTTLDEINGHVTVTPRVDTPFDDLEILLIGTTTTLVDRMNSATAMAGRTDASHRFLRLKQPIPDSDLPEPRVLEAGRTYTYNYTFVIPQQLLPRSCTHLVANSTVRDAHLALPPSLGDLHSIPSRMGNYSLDQLAPEMVDVAYAVQVGLTKLKERARKIQVLAVASRRIYVVPATEEAPPLPPAEGRKSEYRLRLEKTLRSGLLRGKLGRLVMEASQPRSFRYAVPSGGGLDNEGGSSNLISTVSTVVKLRLRFDPSDPAAEPPPLSTVTSKLKCYNFWSIAASKDFPKRSNIPIDFSLGILETTIPLSSYCVASVEWTRIDPNTPPSPRLDDDDDDDDDNAERRPSTFSTASITDEPPAPYPSNRYSPSSPFYTVTVLVPVFLPPQKLFAPTFHSCLASRTYTLGINLSLRGHALAGPLSLRLPVQVSTERGVARGRRGEGSGSSVQVVGGEAVEGLAVGPDGSDSVPLETSISRVSGGLGDGVPPPPAYSVLVRASGGRAMGDGGGLTEMGHHLTVHR